MRVALCHPYVVPGKGGCETYIVDLSRRLIADGHEVHLHAWRWDGAALAAGVQCVRVSGPAECWRHRRPWLFSAACLRSLREAPHDVSVGFDKTWGQDVLFPQGGLYEATARHNRLVPRTAVGRVLTTVRQWADPAFWSFLRLERRQYGESQPLVVVNSRMVRDHFLRTFGTATGRLRVIPSAIDPGRFDASRREAIREEQRRRWGLATEVVGLFAAMNYPLKGLDPLMRAVARVPCEGGFRLVVVGQPRTRRYRLLARWHGVDDRVKFVGHCADMKRAYFAADFLVHPTFYDPCSLVVLEALACGLPVVTTRHNGASELLQPPAEGFVVDDPHDDAQLAWCLRRLLDPGVRERCSRAAREAAARWTFEDHYRALLAVLHEGAGRRAAA